MQNCISAFEIIYKISLYKLPGDVWDQRSLADLNSYVAYINEKMEKAQGKKTKVGKKTYTGDEIEGLFRGGL